MDNEHDEDESVEVLWTLSGTILLERKRLRGRELVPPALNGTWTSFHLTIQNREVLPRSFFDMFLPPSLESDLICRPINCFWRALLFFINEDWAGWEILDMIGIRYWDADIVGWNVDGGFRNFSTSSGRWVRVPALVFEILTRDEFEKCRVAMWVTGWVRYVFWYWCLSLVRWYRDKMMWTGFEVVDVLANLFYLQECECGRFMNGKGW